MLNNYVSNATPLLLIESMLDGQSIQGKTILQPAPGKGEIIDFLLNYEAKAILSVEIHEGFRAALASKCKMIHHDLLFLESNEVGNIHMVVMNPPMNLESKYIQHAFEIAPPGCLIISLCNYTAHQGEYRGYGDKLRELISLYGNLTTLGEGVRDCNGSVMQEVGVIKLRKPGGSYETEFEGFFMFDEQESGENGIMPYNLVQDLVNRYIKAVQIYDEQLTAGLRLEEMIAGYFETPHAIHIRPRDYPEKRSEFKKDLQKSAWNFIFNQLNLQKVATKGLKDDIHKFIEQQTQVPFTMRNIYRMLEIVCGTTTQRMDKALLEVFDKITLHHHENRLSVEAWKTNSHYLVNRKFILPGLCELDSGYHRNNNTIETSYRSNWESVEDLVKALCYISGDEYDSFGSLRDWISHSYKLVTDKEVYFHSEVEHYSGQAAKQKELQDAGIVFTSIHHRPVYGEWFDWAYFRVKAFKKGSIHFEFKDEDVWARFNQRIARLKNYPLFEGKSQTAYQKRQTGFSKSTGKPAA